MITNSEIDKIVILYKDRLVRFGYELIENLCEKYGTTLEIIDNTERTLELLGLSIIILLRNRKKIIEMVENLLAMELSEKN